MTKKSLRILVVEDHADFRRVLGMFLVTLGYEAELAVDAEAALTKARNGRFDLLLTDVHLPGMDAWEMIQRLRTRGDLPCWTISVSGCNSGRELAQSQESGCTQHFFKPFRPSELAILLERLESETSPPASLELNHPPASGR